MIGLYKLLQSVQHFIQVGLRILLIEDNHLSTSCLIEGGQAEGSCTIVWQVHGLGVRNEHEMMRCFAKDVMGYRGWTRHIEWD